MKNTIINHRWELVLLDHRADRPEWPFWEKERLAAMYSVIRPGDTIIDVGAEQGDLTALFAKWVGQAGKMVVIEPSPGFWPNIRATFEANGLKTPACSFQVLAADETRGFERTYDHEEWPECSEGTIAVEPGFSHLKEDPPIPRVKIDDMALPAPDVVTMDCEGSEYEILLGAENMIKTYRPTLFISVHPEFMWEQHRHSPDDLLVMLEKWGYDSTYLAFDHEQHYMFKPRP